MSNLEQSRAANPAYCIRAMANAGTGKTRVLTNRVLRLLLSGVHPSKILCLTYTKAAAAEMISRISEELKNWATIEESKLIATLSELIEEAPSAEQVSIARTIFSKTIESSPPPRIQTIHSFCQEVLKRFPLEAGIAPYFSVIDDISAKEMIEEAKHLLISDKSDSVKYFGEECGEFKFDKILKQVIGCRGKLSEVQGIQLPEKTEQDLINEFFDNGKSVIPAYKTRDFEAVKNFFLTGDGDKRKRIYKKDDAEDLKQILDREQERAYQVGQQIRKLISDKFSHYAYRLGMEFAAYYDLIKKSRTVLDYDDLIQLTHNLLRERATTQWVLYKLDGGIDHILVDEAQDTSPKQWEIIEALAEEFFAGETRAETNRTIFIVGDEKQSIYSFQGANPDKFIEITSRIKERAIAAGKIWHDVVLKKSYRSVSPVLNFVDKVFEDEELKNLISKSDYKIAHEVHREGEGGLVEVLPLFQDDEKEDLKPWTMPNTFVKHKDAEQKIAEYIAKNIHTWLKEKRVLASKGRGVEAQDIMILLRKRGALADLIIKNLKKRSIPVSGADRLKITEHIAIEDLIALTNFCLLPSDDLSLACALKSPLFGISEEELFELCYKRESTIFSQILKTKPNLAEQLKQITNKADLLTIHEFYSFILNELGGRKKFISRLGDEVNDVLDEFMDLCLEFETSRQASLQTFVKYLSNSDMEIKRDMEQAGNQVRVMTIHGSKGLQAPIVFIADANSVPKLNDDLFFEGNLLGSKSSDERSEEVEDIIEAEKQKIYAEYMRLLYVAATRAEDELYILGAEKTREQGVGESWYKYIAKIEDKFTCEQAKPIKQDKKPISEEDNSTLPEYMDEKVAQQSKLFEDITEKSEKIDKIKIKRGKKIHKILELITNADRDSIIAKLGDDECKIVERLLKDARTARLFVPTTFSEMPIIGKIGERTISAKIDKVVVSESEVLVVDFKTSANPPQTVPEAYIRQLGDYAELLRLKYPDKAIKAAILWTETGRFDEVSLTLGSGDNIYDISKTA